MIRKAGRPKERDPEETISKAKQLFTAGYTQLEVSQKLGFNKIQTMRVYFSRNNISIKQVQGVQV